LRVAEAENGWVRMRCPPITRSIPIYPQGYNRRLEPV
jgi:hypothetical protein